MPRCTFGFIAIKHLEMLQQIVWIHVAARMRELHQGTGLARNHKHARRGCSKNETVDTFSKLEGELLRHCAAPRNAHHIHFTVAKFIENAGCHARKLPGTIGIGRRRRTADARRVESDQVAIAERLGKRSDKFDIRANSIEEQKRTVPPLPFPDSRAEYVGPNSDIAVSGFSVVHSKTPDRTRLVTRLMTKGHQPNT